MPSHIVKRRLRNGIAVADRIVRRTLHVDRIIGAADGAADQVHAVGLQQIHEGADFFQVRVHAQPGAVAAESIRISPLPVHRLARTVLTLDEGHDVENTQPHGKFQLRHRRPDPFQNFPAETGAVLKGAAILAGSVIRREKLVGKIAVCVLDIHKIETGGISHLRSRNKMLHNIFHFFIADNIRL